MKNLVRCAAIAKKDGQRCGRRAAEGELLCHIHRAAAEGKPVSALTAPTAFDPKEKLLRIGANDRHPQQLQALKVLLHPDGEEGSCRECADRKEHDQTANAEYDATLRAMTDDEYQRHRELTEEWIAAYNKCKEFRTACAERIAQKGKAQ